MYLPHFAFKSFYEAKEQINTREKWWMIGVSENQPEECKM